jgi:hypothetical protein
MPEEWKEMGKAMETAGAGFTASSAETSEALVIAATSAASVVEAIELAAKAQGHFNAKTKESLSTMDKMATTAGKVGKTIFDMSVTLLKFASFGAIIGGIGTVLGGLGLADLAGSVLVTSKTAAGLGVSPGELKSWQINMQRYAGAGILQGASEAQINPQKWGYLGALGINPQQAQNESPADLAMQIVNATKRAYAQNPDTNSAQFQAAHALGLSPEDWRNIGTSGAGLSSAQKNYRSDVGALGWDKKTSDDWSQLSITLDRAKGSIEKAFIQGLEPLTVPGGPLALLATDVSDAVKAFMTGPGAAQLITDFGAALKSFGVWLGSANFQSDMKTFATGVAAIAKELYHALQFFHLIPHTDADEESNAADDVAQAKAGDAQYKASLDNNDIRNAYYGLKKLFGGSGAPAYRRSKELDTSLVNYFEKQGYSASASTGIAANIISESGVDPNAVGDHGAAYGIGQWQAPRQAAFAEIFGHSIQQSTLQEQLKFYNDELSGKTNDTGAAKAGAILGDAGITPEQAAAIVSKYFERPAATAQEEQKRAALAAQIAAEVNKSSTKTASQSPLKITVHNPTSARLTFAANTASV